MLPWCDPFLPFMEDGAEWVLVLPPFHGGPGAFAAAATRLPRALGASREELGHELGHVWKLWVGIQHVHGLFHFLEMKGKV